MSKRLYVAYGSNLNKAQMKHRCPTAKLHGAGRIDGYELQFKGAPQGAFATIAPKEGACVPVAVWEIQPQDEAALDRYEGYPSHYFKQDVAVQLDGEEAEAMVYIMNLQREFGMPSPYYYQAVREGYLNCGLDTAVLDEAVKESAQKFYREYQRRARQQTLLGFEVYGGESDEEQEEDNEPEMEDDPSCSFEGMHW